ncbi:hypothetical protein C3B54_11438 [Pontimonas salivibrio]|uniref:Uncharacterized protein n=1 Tax=Pontimonas salivibrio TaxID=1159327 RepID=A0A2L2BP41_9MICO|nr:DUF3027 domain-containing protein [Pontimonas salivibrio]AVG23433.1 hypothetical protein C3B54_11438 [Pontimonas salivibrio]
MAKKPAATKKPSVPDGKTLTELAHTALLEVAPPADIGTPHGVESADDVYAVRFDSEMSGYPGWQWLVTMSDGDGGQWGVLEIHLVPGPDALVSPDWVPWSERLEEYQRSEAERIQAEADAQALKDEEADDGADDDADDDPDLDDDLDDDDLDGVDIDQLDLDPSGLEIPDEPNDVFDHVIDEDDDDVIDKD